MEEIIIALAKASVLVALNEPSDFNLTLARQHFPELNKEHAVFVTLRTLPSHKLRGCIGSLIAHRPLYKDIIINARHATLDDSRFKPLTKEAFKNISIEVSILSTPKIVHYQHIHELKTQITPLKDGVVLTLGRHRATYLPSVWKELNTFDDFFSSLCLKAHLEKTCLAEHPTLQTYQVLKYKEQ